MRFTKTPGNWKVLTVATVAFCFVAASAFAFVISCEDQLAEAYPTELKADLSACDAGERTLTADTGVAADGFAATLNGTWTLRSRTAHGLTLNDATRAATFYADIEAQGDRLAGSVLLLDHPAGQDVLASDDGMAAFWGVTGTVRDGREVVVAMDGSALGSYAHVRVGAKNGLEFQRYRGAFVADSPASTWDRVVLMDDSLTFVSCEEGLVERYVRVDDREPTIDGASIESYWQELRSRSSIAGSAAPVAVDVLAAR